MIIDSIIIFFCGIIVGAIIVFVLFDDGDSEHYAP